MQLLEAARVKFTEAMNATGFQADLAYAIGLCYYQQRLYGPSLKHIAEIIERGVREHPELSVGSQTEGVDVRSVGNSAVLKETALIEAFNLKAAIEYLMKNHEVRQDDPPRCFRRDVPPRCLPRSSLALYRRRKRRSRTCRRDRTRSSTLCRCTTPR